MLYVDIPSREEYAYLADILILPTKNGHTTKRGYGFQIAPG